MVYSETCVVNGTLNAVRHAVILSRLCDVMPVTTVSVSGSLTSFILKDKQSSILETDA